MEKKSSGWLKFTISVKLIIKLQTRVHFIVFQGYSKVKLEGACKKTDHFLNYVWSCFWLAKLINSHNVTSGEKSGPTSRGRSPNICRKSLNCPQMTTKLN